jgi:hypothetical protein
MLTQRTLLSIFALIALSLTSTAIRAADTVPPPTGPATVDPAQLESWWNDLQKPEPESSRALLRFSGNPDATVAFFKDKLKPLTIDADRVHALIDKLGSDDEAVWRPAFEELEYFDPRLAIDLETLMKETTKSPTRERLVTILSGRPIESVKALEGKKVELRATGPAGSGDFNFTADRGSWWAEGNVARLNQGGWGNKSQWTRAVRAITLLAYFGTPNAVAILKDMSTGNPDAQPTKAAKEALTQPQ